MTGPIEQSGRTALKVMESIIADRLSHQLTSLESLELFAALSLLVPRLNALDSPTAPDRRSTAERLRAARERTDASSMTTTPSSTRITTLILRGDSTTLSTLSVSTDSENSIRALQRIVDWLNYHLPALWRISVHPNPSWQDSFPIEASALSTKTTGSLREQFMQDPYLLAGTDHNPRMLREQLLNVEANERASQLALSPRPPFLQTKRTRAAFSESTPTVSSRSAATSTSGQAGVGNAATRTARVPYEIFRKSSLRKPKPKKPVSRCRDVSRQKKS